MWLIFKIGLTAMVACQLGAGLCIWRHWDKAFNILIALLGLLIASIVLALLWLVK